MKLFTTQKIARQQWRKSQDVNALTACSLSILENVEPVAIEVDGQSQHHRRTLTIIRDATFSIQFFNSCYLKSPLVWNLFKYRTARREVNIWSMVDRSGLKPPKWGRLVYWRNLGYSEILIHDNWGRLWDSFLIDWAQHNQTSLLLYNIYSIHSKITTTTQIQIYQYVAYTY